MKKPQKMYVVRKYILAGSAQEALRKESSVVADDCWIDDDWRKNDKDQLTSIVGFHDKRM